MNGITLNVLWYNEEDLSRRDSGLEPIGDINDADIKEHTFFNIDFVRPYCKDYCEVSVSNSLYVIKDSYESVRQKIYLSKIGILN